MCSNLSNIVRRCLIDVVIQPVGVKQLSGGAPADNRGLSGVAAGKIVLGYVDGQALLHIPEVLPGEGVRVILRVPGDEEPPVKGYATQSGFEEIDKAVITAKNPKASEKAKIQAGEVFSGLDGTELFEMFTARFSSIGGRIMELMNAYLDNLASGDTAEKRLKVPAHAEDFDIRDYV